MARGPRKPPTLRLDPDGVPVDGRDWTEQDWADLHHGMAAIKARIAARHGPEARKGDDGDAATGATDGG